MQQYELANKEGRASIEHQLSIHVNDLFDVDYNLNLLSPTPASPTTTPTPGGGAGGGGAPPELSLEEVLAGLRYVMDYRLKGGKQPHLDFDLMKKLVDALLLHMRHNERQRLFHSERPTDEANTAFTIFGEMIEEVVEFRQAVRGVAVADLQYSLRIDRRCKVAELRDSALAMLEIITLHIPSHFTWPELVRSKDHEYVEELLDEYRKDKKPPRMPVSKRVVLPPPALYFDRRVERVIDMFQTDINSGLSSEQVARHRDFYGINELPRPPSPSLLKMFIRQITDLMVLILIAAAIIAFSTGDSNSGIVLMVVVVINVIIGFQQEVKANLALEALMSLSVPKATVIRDGEQGVVTSQDLVPGDLVILDEGDAVPADLRLVEVSQLEVVESILTGESLGILKSPEPISTRTRKLPLGDCLGNAFMSTFVGRGRAKGVVVRTGDKTEIGKISSAISSAPELKTPMQINLARLGIILVVVSVVLCLLVIIIGIARGKRVDEMFRIGMTLAVSVIPEGLVAIVTVTLAIGVTRMAEQNAIVRRIPSVETLGSVAVICSDKTGTLTEGKMTGTLLWTTQMAEYNLVARNDKGQVSVALASGSPNLRPEDHPTGFLIANMACALCNNSAAKLDENGSVEYTGDPTEIALLVASLNSGMGKDFFGAQSMERIIEFPFDSDRKMMSVIYSRSSIPEMPQSTECVFVKGAPEAVLSRSVSYVSESGSWTETLDDQVRSIITQKATSMASNGLRVLGLAFRQISDSAELEKLKSGSSDDIEAELCFVGLIGLIDPPKSGVRDSISKCKKAGINVIMITGDHIITAAAIASDLGILEKENPSANRAIKGVDLDLLSEEGLKSLKPFPNVFARVSPDNKLRIVQALQSQKKTIAMTGDGVNDAPAIKAANVGIAMGIGGTEITKQAADIVLADDNFTTIESAVREGRRVYDNIQKFVLYLLSCNFAEIFVMLLAVIIGVEMPFTAIMILWANIFADIPPSMAIGLEPEESDIMERHPRSSDEGVITRRAAVVIAFQSTLMGAVSLAAYLGTLAAKGILGTPEAFEQRDPEAQTLTFILLTAMQLFQSFLSRSMEASLFTTGVFGNPWLVASFIFSLAVIIISSFVPGWRDFLELVPLTEWYHWVIIVGACVFQLICSEIFKAVLRCLTERKQAAMMRLPTVEGGLGDLGRKGDEEDV